MSRIHVLFGLIVFVLIAFMAWLDQTIREGLVAVIVFVSCVGLFFWVGPRFVAFCDDFKERLTEATIGETDE